MRKVRADQPSRRLLRNSRSSACELTSERPYTRLGRLAQRTRGFCARIFVVFNFHFLSIVVIIHSLALGLPRILIHPVFPTTLLAPTNNAVSEPCGSLLRVHRCWGDEVGIFLLQSRIRLGFGVFDMLQRARRAEHARLVHINDFPRRRSMSWTAHHRFIVEDDTFARPECSSGSGEVTKHDEGLAPHFLGLERDDVYNPAIGGEVRV